MVPTSPFNPGAPVQVRDGAMVIYWGTELLDWICITFATHVFQTLSQISNGLLVSVFAMQSLERSTDTILSCELSQQIQYYHMSWFNRSNTIMWVESADTILSCELIQQIQYYHVSWVNRYNTIVWVESTDTILSCELSQQIQYYHVSWFNRYNTIMWVESTDTILSCELSQQKLR